MVVRFHFLKPSMYLLPNIAMKIDYLPYKNLLTALLKWLTLTIRTTPHGKNRHIRTWDFRGQTEQVIF